MDDVFALIDATYDWSDAIRLRRGAKAAAKAESASQRKMREAFSYAENQLIKSVVDGSAKDVDLEDIDELLVGMAGDAMQSALEHQPRVMLTKFAKPKQASKKGIPRTPAELRDWLDYWRKKAGKGLPPKPLKDVSKKIEKAWKQAVKTVQRKAVDAREAGKPWDREQAAIEVEAATKQARSRAKTIVATETTRYFNEVRREYYDSVEGVTHYIYLAIRDSRTTDWCKPGVGRHGLIYRKGSAYLERELPPTHWNCRSEIAPLSPDNPKHRRMINDRSRARENNKPTPLPKGWNQ